MNKLDQLFPPNYCRKCNTQNLWTYFAPFQDAAEKISVICYPCAVSRNWVNPITGNLKEGVLL